MPNRYIDELSDKAIHFVMGSYKKSTGMEITYNQAISAMYGAWLKLHKGADKQC